MKTPVQLKNPATYAGLGVLFGAIAQLVASNGTDTTGWASLAASLIAIFSKARSDQAQ
jgi:hypothetical protein